MVDVAMPDEPFELEPGVEDFKPLVDQRRRIEEPLPVKLVAVADVIAGMREGVEERLDDFYVTMLEFEKESAGVYRAENFRLRLEGGQGGSEDLRPIGIEVRSLAVAEGKLMEREMEYQRQKGLLAGSESLLLLDPAGNWVELVEARPV
jgi:hypothetical protein